MNRPSVALPSAQRTFKVVLIRPSHYDSEGYVIQWRRGVIPSNSLASVHGVLTACASDKVLGPDVAIDIEVHDEGGTIISVRRTIQAIRAAGSGFVGLVGVQSNQFPRALDLARQFRAADIPVVIGGFHASGCIAMLPELPPDLQEALDLGVTLFAGEAEGRLADLLRDVDAGRIEPVYNYLKDMPDLAGAPLPMLPREILLRNVGTSTSLDAGRGCPFQCSFCTIINVQGRKSRYRTADDVEAIVRANLAQGIRRFFVTDDNFARNRNWEAILDRLILMQEREGLFLRLILQVDTLCHRIPGFIEKAARAGCKTVFIGLESINPESLAGTKKRQNKIWEYREMLQAWRNVGVMTYAGYIIGFPSDTPESIARDIDIIKKELPIDLLEFFVLTPLPGSEDHKVLSARGEPMASDMNIYDVEHVCMAHPRMSKTEWEQAYRDAWTRYYSPEHIETIMRRACASGIHLSKVTNAIMYFCGATAIEGVHPLQVGLIRRKIRTQRRHGMALESPWAFYPRRAAELLRSGVRWGWLAFRLRRLRKRVETEQRGRTYTDEALRPTRPDRLDHLVEVFADKIPRTHGAPVREPVAG